MIDFIKSSSLYSEKSKLNIRGEIFRLGDFSVRVGSLYTGSSSEQSIYSKLLFVQFKYEAGASNLDQVVEKIGFKKLSPTAMHLDINDFHVNVIERLQG